MSPLGRAAALCFQSLWYLRITISSGWRSTSRPGDAYLLRTQPQTLAYSDQITVSVKRTTSFVASPKALSSALIGRVAAAETGADAVNLFEARTSPLRQDTDLGVLALTRTSKERISTII